MDKCTVCGAPLTEGHCLACAKARQEANVLANKTAEDKIKAENSRREEIHAMGQQHKCSHLAAKAIMDGTTADDFRAMVLRTVYNARPIVDPTASTLGMDSSDIDSYSIVRAIRQLSEGKQLDGVERQASDATAKLCKREAKGFFIPTDIMRAHRVNQIRAALNSTTGTQGGFLSDTTVLVSDMIELLRNKTLVAQMGARSLGGLVGNVAIPRVNGGATAYWLNESGTATESDQSFGQLGLVPKRLVGDTAYQKELMLQTSLDVEGFVRDDLMRVLAIAKDLAALFGTGGSQPLGIFNTTGIGSVTFGAAATWAKILDFETQIATANADVANMGFITSPGVRAKWKAATKIASSQYSDFLWEKGAQAGSGVVNSYRAEVTNQIPNSGTFAHRVVMANFADMILADWAGIDVVVDPFSLKKSGQIEVTITIWTDFGIRHVGSVCISSDSGAQ